MLKKNKQRLGALVAVAVSTNLLSLPFTAQAEEVETDATTNQVESLDKSSTSDQMAITASTSSTEESPAVAASQASTANEPAQAASVAESDTSLTATASTSKENLAAETARTTETANTTQAVTSNNAEPAAQTATLAQASTTSAAPSQNVIMAAYKYANPNDDYWQRITSQTGSKISHVIINPSNGAGNRADANFARQIAANAAAGIQNIGYVNTVTRDFSGISRSHDDILAEVARYASFYGADNINGIFFDEVKAGETEAEVNFMRTLFYRMRELYPNMTVMANPGRTITNAIAPYADIWLTRETTAADYLTGHYEQISDAEKDPASSKRFMHLIHSASPSQYDEIIALSRERNAGYLMVTDQTFLALPTDFESLVGRITAGGSVSSTSNSAIATDGNRSASPTPSTANEAAPSLEGTIATEPAETIADSAPTEEITRDTSGANISRNRVTRDISNIANNDSGASTQQTDSTTNTSRSDNPTSLPSEVEDDGLIQTTVPLVNNRRNETSGRATSLVQTRNQVGYPASYARRPQVLTNLVNQNGPVFAQNPVNIDVAANGALLNNRQENQARRERRNSAASQETGREGNESRQATENADAKKTQDARTEGAKSSNTADSSTDIEANSQQAAASTNHSVSAQDNSGLYLALTGAVTLAGLGLLGRAALKSKKED